MNIRGHSVFLWERVPGVGAEIRKAREPSARLWRGPVRRNAWFEEGCGEDLPDMEGDQNLAL